MEGTLRRRLTIQAFHSIVSAIFRKGAFLMNRFGSVSTLMINANTMKHVRTAFAYGNIRIREE